MVLYCDYIKICTQDQDAAFSLEGAYVLGSKKYIDTVQQWTSIWIHDDS